MHHPAVPDHLGHRTYSRRSKRVRSCVVSSKPRCGPHKTGTRRGTRNSRGRGWYEARAHFRRWPRLRCDMSLTSAARNARWRSLTPSPPVDALHSTAPLHVGTC